MLVDCEREDDVGVDAMTLSSVHRLQTVGRLRLGVVADFLGMCSCTQSRQGQHLFATRQNVVCD